MLNNLKFTRWLLTFSALRVNIIYVVGTCTHLKKAIYSTQKEGCFYKKGYSKSCPKDINMTKKNKLLLTIFAAVCILAGAGVIALLSLSGGNPDDYKSYISALSALSMTALLLVGALLHPLSGTNASEFRRRQAFFEKMCRDFQVSF